MNLDDQLDAAAKHAVDLAASRTHATDGERLTAQIAVWRALHEPASRQRLLERVAADAIHLDRAHRRKHRRSIHKPQGA